jgi:hypothetical protein
VAEDLIRAAVRKFRFRSRHAGETEADYRMALIAFVAHRDFAAGHELRLGKRQADWSSADAHSFQEHLVSLPRSTHDPNVPFACPCLTNSERSEVTDDALLRLARRAVDFCIEFRTKDPTKDFAVMASVLLTTGEVMHAMPSRDDRIRVLKFLSKQYPVYGFFLSGDMFLHGVTRDPVTHEERAQKQDAFVVHVGSRTMRRAFTQPYRVEAGRAIFEPLRELTLENIVEDPYADVFVSVPLPTGRPS